MYDNGLAFSQLFVVTPVSVTIEIRRCFY